MSIASKWLERMDLDSEVDKMLHGEPTEDTVTEPADELVTVKVSNEEAIGEEILEDHMLAKLDEEMGTIIEATTTLEHYHSVLRRAESNGGLRPETVAVMRVGLAHLDRQIRGLQTPIVASLEAFDGRRSVALATGVSIESMGETIKQLGQRVLQLLKQLLDAGKDAWTRYQAGAHKVRERAEAVLAATPQTTIRGDFSFQPHSMYFGDGNFYADKPYAVDGVLDYLTADYPYSTKRMLEELKRQVGLWDGGSSSALIGTMHSLRQLSQFPGKFVKTIPGTAGIEVDVYRLGPGMGNQAFAFLWPNKKDFNDSHSLVDIFNNIRFQMMTVDEAAAPPNKLEMDYINGNEVRSRMQEVIKKLDVLEKLDSTAISTTYTEEIKAIIATLERKKTESTEEGGSNHGVMLINGLSRLAANQMPAFSGIYAYVVKALATQVQFAEQELRYLKAEA